MNHLALFNGIGGFQLAAHWCGWRNVAHVEINPFCNKVINQHFPQSVCHTDIFEFDGTAYSNTIDIISGGFPCQPFSVAGKRKSSNDKRFLWPQMLRVIWEVKPPYVVCENVPGLVTVDNGRTFKRILSDLESAGYTIESFIIPASSVGAWHKRDRLWIIAYTHNGRNLRTTRKNERKGKTERVQERNQMEQPKQSSKLWEQSILSNTERKLCHEREYGNDIKERKIQLQTGGKNSIFTDTNNAGCKEQREPITDGEKLFAPKCPDWWKTEPGLDRVVNGLPDRVERIKALGNAIVPQIAYEIFKAIQQHYNETK